MGDYKLCVCSSGMLTGDPVVGPQVTGGDLQKTWTPCVSTSLSSFPGTEGVFTLGKFY